MGRIWTGLIILIVVGFLAGVGPAALGDMIGDALGGLITFLGQLADGLDGEDAVG